MGVVEKHTPGPWRVENAEIRSKSKLIVQVDYWHKTHAEGDANAKFISAAPDMENALELAKEWLPSRRAIPEEIHDQIDAALAKARGE